MSWPEHVRPELVGPEDSTGSAALGKPWGTGQGVEPGCECGSAWQEHALCYRARGYWWRDRMTKWPGAAAFATSEAASATLIVR